MTRESLLETLVTAAHQVAASGVLPEALKSAATGVELDESITIQKDLRSRFVVEPSISRESLASTIDATIRSLTRHAAARLGAGNTLVETGSGAAQFEHPEPIFLAPGLAVFVGAAYWGETLFATIRLVFGIATAA